MSEHQVRMVVLSTDDLDASIELYEEALGLSLAFRDGDHFAALDAGSVTLALATPSDHPRPGTVAVGIRADDVDAAAEAVVAAGGRTVTAPFDGPHERRAVVEDAHGNTLVFYRSLPR